MTERAREFLVSHPRCCASGRLVSTSSTDTFSGPTLRNSHTEFFTIDFFLPDEMAAMAERGRASGGGEGSDTELRESGQTTTGGTRVRQDTEVKGIHMTRPGANATSSVVAFTRGPGARTEKRPLHRRAHSHASKRGDCGREKWEKPLLTSSCHVRIHHLHSVCLAWSLVFWFVRSAALSSSFDLVFLPARQCPRVDLLQRVKSSRAGCVTLMHSCGVCGVSLAGGSSKSGRERPNPGESSSDRAAC